LTEMRLPPSNRQLRLTFLCVQSRFRMYNIEPGSRTAKFESPNGQRASGFLILLLRMFSVHAFRPGNALSRPGPASCVRQIVGLLQRPSKILPEHVRLPTTQKSAVRVWHRAQQQLASIVSSLWHVPIHRSGGGHAKHYVAINIGPAMSNVALWHRAPVRGTAASRGSLGGEADEGSECRLATWCFLARIRLAPGEAHPKVASAPETTRLCQLSHMGTVQVSMTIDQPTATGVGMQKGLSVEDAIYDTPSYRAHLRPDRPRRLTDAATSGGGVSL